MKTHYEFKADSDYEKNRRNINWKHYKTYWSGNFFFEDLEKEFIRKDALKVLVLGVVVGGFTSYFVLRKIEK